MIDINDIVVLNGSLRSFVTRTGYIGSQEAETVSCEVNIYIKKSPLFLTFTA